MKNTNKKT